jgi:protein-S-isoprenylcysteine O-methyltransferase Ste14
MDALEHRIPPPIVALLTGAAMWAAARGASAAALPFFARVGLSSLLFVAAGAFGFPALVAFRRAHTTTNPVRIDRAAALVTSGVYRFTRNPMYVALTLLLCAWAVWLLALPSALGPLVFASYINRFQIVPEERAMRAKFGEAYDAYRLRTRRWL